MTKKIVVEINWVALFNAMPFRRGWTHSRMGLPIDGAVHITELNDQMRAALDTFYALGRQAAIEAVGLQLPDPAPYFSMQMRMVLEACPEMKRELMASSVRHFLNPSAKSNIA